MSISSVLGVCIFVNVCNISVFLFLCVLVVIYIGCVLIVLCYVWLCVVSFGGVVMLNFRLLSMVMLWVLSDVSCFVLVGFCVSMCEKLLNMLCVVVLNFVVCWNECVDICVLVNISGMLVW